MRYVNGKAEDLKIAYIGGGSRGWAWGLMSDLAAADDMSGSVYLYDIDLEAAKRNEVIGNKVKELKDCKSPWDYKAVETIGEALQVRISWLFPSFPAPLTKWKAMYTLRKNTAFTSRLGIQQAPGADPGAARGTHV